MKTPLTRFIAVNAGQNLDLSEPVRGTGPTKKFNMKKPEIFMLQKSGYFHVALTKAKIVFEKGDLILYSKSVAG